MESNDIEVNDMVREPLLPLAQARDLFDIIYVINAILRSSGNITRAAEELEMGRRTLYELMDKHGISCAEGKLSIDLTPLLCYIEVHSPSLEKYLT